MVIIFAYPECNGALKYTEGCKPFVTRSPNGDTGGEKEGVARRDITAVNCKRCATKKPVILSAGGFLLER